MLTRRELVKCGITAATLSGLSPRLVHADDDGGVGRSPFRTNPFVEPLPFPPVKEPVGVGPACREALSSTGVTQANPGTHQYIERTDCAPTKAYEIHVAEGVNSFHPNIPPTKIFGYDGIAPGPTFKAFYGEPIMVRFFNELPADHVGFGIASISTHLHNGHTASESDGFPGNFHDSRTFWDNHYINAANGFSADPPTTNGVTECMGTLWYHDHRQDFTAQNVYAGLAGFYLLYDSLDCNDETDPRGLQLPSGDFDVPLVFADKVFDADGQLFYDFFNLGGILGDKYTVNGKIQPFFEVQPRKYRFRLLDAGPSRFYAFALSDGTPLIQIANDGNLLAAPIARSVVTCGVAERHDVIVDFSKYRPGDKVYLMNRAEQDDGRGPTGKLLTPGVPLVEFRVTLLAATDQSQIRPVLRPVPPMDLSQVVKTRTWEFDRSDGGWTVNDKFFNVNEVRASVKCNTCEVWTLKNGGGGWSHPIHVHLEEYRTLSRNGRTPPPWEDRKDVVVLGPDDVARVFFNFRDFVGRYPMHCHNVVHEDHAMMIRFDVVP